MQEICQLKRSTSLFPISQNTQCSIRFQYFINHQRHQLLKFGYHDICQTEIFDMLRVKNILFEIDFSTIIELEDPFIKLNRARLHHLAWVNSNAVYTNKPKNSGVDLCTQEALSSIEISLLICAAIC